MAIVADGDDVPPGLAGAVSVGGGSGAVLAVAAGAVGVPVPELLALVVGDPLAEAVVPAV
jgi:hypothetical protein